MIERDHTPGWSWTLFRATSRSTAAYPWLASIGRDTSEQSVERVSQPLDGERTGHGERAVRERDAGRADAKLDTLHNYEALTARVDQRLGVYVNATVLVAPRIVIAAL